MNWLIKTLVKEARERRFRADDKVRYFTNSQKGKGKGIVLTPRFNRGTVLNFDTENRRYKIRDERTQEEHDVHPRNLIPDSVSRSTAPKSEPYPVDMPMPELIPVQLDTIPAI